MINNTIFNSPSKQKRNTSLLCYKGSYYREGRKNEICSAVGVSDHGSHGHHDIHHSFCTPSQLLSWCHRVLWHWWWAKNTKTVENLFNATILLYSKSFILKNNNATVTGVILITNLSNFHIECNLFFLVFVFCVRRRWLSHIAPQSLKSSEKIKPKISTTLFRVHTFIKI